MALGLNLRISIRTTQLRFIADAAVEVFVAVHIAPEFRPTFEAVRFQYIIDELGDRTVQALHHRLEIVAD